MQTLSQRNGRHVSRAQVRGALQNPAYRLADIYVNEGFGASTPGPSPFQRLATEGLRISNPFYSRDALLVIVIRFSDTVTAAIAASQ